MDNKVELINNPYTQRLRILINGEAVSVYSNLEKYFNEPFSYWCERILNDIFEECNQAEFTLHFQSRDEERIVMEKIVSNYPHCNQYSSSSFIRKTSLIERMKVLSGIIKQLDIREYKNIRKTAVFIIPESLQELEDDLLELEVRNCFCQIDTAVTYLKEFQNKKMNFDVLFLILEQGMQEEYIKKHQIREGFVIVLGDRNRFCNKINDVFVYESSKEDIFQTIFECLAFLPLAQAFYECISSIPVYVKNKYKKKFDELESIDWQVIPKLENTTIELGKSSRIQFETDMIGYTIKGTQLRYSYTPDGIISCNGMLVEGKKVGKATLHIYKEGEQLPCANVDYRVILRNRITELHMEEKRIEIGEGDRMNLSYSYYPPNADNTDKIEWHSDNTDIAVVDNKGRVTAKGIGKCILRCFAEQVSASCDCVVKPHLKKITLESRELDMIYGGEYTLNVQLFPENCIDDTLKIASMNMQIANVVGRTIKAVGMGNTRIVIQNKEETVCEEIQVNVYSEKDYKKLTKQKEKNLQLESSGEKKKGLFSKLFG